MTINNLFLSQIVSSEKFTDLRSIDVHLTQPWILVGHGKLLSMWDYKRQEPVVALGVVGATIVYSVRFIPRRDWFVAGDDNGYIHVYLCVTWKEVKSFQARDGGSSDVTSLAIHPTSPYLLSACTDGVVKLWDWDSGWECIRTVHSTAGLMQVKFNPKDTDTFTSCCAKGTMRMEIWSIYPSDEPIAAIEQNSSSLYDHVFTEGDQNHVVMLIHGLGLQESFVV
ncbi:coatomer subunit beta'-3-like [Triticum urartu]|uniref:coatomer subunit beta'-3-like n=1 Tax=Triticum urartu TaxID=4572 RepID=UPI0020431FDD|nr:coatomer subunit beta'-3-like [Triticum urartu]